MTTRISLALAAAASFIPGLAHAFEADGLPADNLVENPWFRSAANPDVAGFGNGVWLRETRDGSTLVASASGDQRPSGSLTIGLTQKPTNPSGTGARWAEDRSDGCSLDRSGLSSFRCASSALLLEARSTVTSSRRAAATLLVEQGLPPLGCRKGSPVGARPASRPRSAEAHGAETRSAEERGQP